MIEFPVFGLPKKFWVVTKPRSTSELCDICFETTFAGFARNIKGGLEVEEIFGIYEDERQASHAANYLLGKKT